LPTFQTINTPIQQCVPGYPTYLLGTFDYGAATGNFTITNAARTAFACTLTVAVKEGNLPIVGQLVSVLCSNATFNVSQAALTAVSFNAATGIGTITYAGTTFGEVVSVAATGQVVAFVPEIGETLTAKTSAPASIQANTGPNNGRDIRFEVIVSGGTPTATVAVQSATNNIDSEYVTETAVSTSLSFTSANGTKAYTLVDARARYYRFVISGVSGGSTPVIVAKVLC